MRNLKIQVLGKVSPTALAPFSSLFNTNTINNYDYVAFCGYSEFDIPVGHMFSTIKGGEDGEILILNCRIRLETVTQQFAFSDESIPYGWKTICKFSFVDGVIPEIVCSLPILDSWFESSHKYLYFSD